MNEFIVKNGLIVSGSTRVQGSVTAQSFTGSFTGSIAFATSASYAVTASYALNAADSVWTGSAGFIYYNQGNVGIGTTAAFTIGGTAVNSIYAAGPSTYGLSNTDAVYLRRYGTGQYQFQTTANGGNTGDLSLQSYGGNVGIGTTSPGQKLSVSGNISLDTGGYIYGDTTTPYLNLSQTNGTLLSYGSTSQLYLAGSVTTLSAGNNYLGFITNGSEVIRITAGGNVGIGTTNPIYKLQVVGSTYVNGGTLFIDSGQFLMWGNSAQGIRGVNSTSLDFYAGSTVRMTIADGGNVGIGVTTPQAKLQVSGSTNVLNVRGSGSVTTSSIFSVDGNNGRLFEVSDDLSNSLFSVNTIAGLPVIEAFADYSVTMGTYGQYVLQVTGSNVGIGSSAPGAKLDVNGNVRATSFTGSISGSATNAVSASYALTASYALNAGDSIWTGSAGNIYYNGGNVGIGTTSPAYKLDVIGNARIGQSSNSSTNAQLDITAGGSSYNAVVDYGYYNTFDASIWKAGMFGDDGNKFKIQFTGGGPAYDVFTISGTSTFAFLTGSMGIGTTNPGNKLTVYSDTTADGILVDVLSRPRITLRDRGNSDTIIGTGDYGLDDFFIDTYSGNAFAIKGSTRNIGIGTTNPAYNLHTYGSNPRNLIHDSGTGYPIVQLLNDSGNLYMAIDNSTGSGFGSAYGRYLYSNGAYPLIFVVNSNEVIRITSGGNVGIGTTSPAKKLDVQVAGGDGIRVSNSTNPAYYTDLLLNYNDVSTLQLTLQGTPILQAGSTDATKLLSRTNQNILITPDGTGNVLINNGKAGIGSTEPQRKLDSYTAGGAALGNNYVRFGVGAAGAYGGNNHLEFSYNDYGNLGGRAFDNILAKIEGNTDVVTPTDVGGILVFSTKARGGTYLTAPLERMRITHAGSVGVGTTSPTATLEVIGNVKATSFTGSFSGSITHAVSASYALTASYALNAGDSIWTGSGADIYYNQGNVGIGVTSPSAKLDISVTPSAAWMNLINGNETAFRLTTYNNGTNNGPATYAFKHGLYYNTTENAAVTFYRGGSSVGGFLTFTTDNGAERMRITDTGNVGIGITNPSSKLHVTATTDPTINIGTLNANTGNAGIQFFSGTGGSNNGFLLQYIKSSSTDRLGFIDGGSGERLTIVNGGNVGIGTTAPQSKLEIRSSGAGNAGAVITLNRVGAWGSAYSGLKLNTDDAGTDWWNVGMLATTTNTFNIGQNGSAMISILVDGNIGIGTTSPTYKLHTYGTNPRVFIQDSSTGYPILQLGNNSSGNFYFAIDNSAGTGFGSAYGRFLYSEGAYPMVFVTNSAEAMRITSAGNVGIGITNPARLLDINGTTNFRDATYFANGGVGYITWGTINSNNALNLQAASGYFLNFGTNATTGQMVIDTSGNVGIGSTAPVFKLDVNGNARIGANTSQQTIAALQVSAGQGAATTYRDIDIHGAWAAGEAHAITATHATTSSDIVGQIVFQHDSPGSRIKFGRLYDSGNQSTYPMELVSNGSSANLTVTGNVGIGTTSPGTRLDISQPSDTSYAITVQNLTGRYAYIGYSGTYQLDFGATGTNDIVRYGVFNAGSGYATFYTSNSERMRITSTGNVGIGSTAPAFTLDVNGNVAIATKLSVGTTYNGFAANIAGVVYVIGASVWVNDGSGYTNANSPGTGFLPYSDGTLVFNSVNSEKMRISASGLVGIGTNNPLFPLDVIGTIRATTVIETSARKYKTNIQNLEPQLNKVLQLQPVTFDWKEKKGERPSIGLIADDVINIYPEFVVKNKENEIEGIDYSKLTAVLIQSVKELKEIIDRQQEQINALLTK